MVNSVRYFVEKVNNSVRYHVENCTSLYQPNKQTNGFGLHIATLLPELGLLLLGHVSPVAAGHVAQLLAGVDAFADADGLEVGAPKVLQQLVVIT